MYSKIIFYTLLIFLFSCKSQKNGASSDSEQIIQKSFEIYMAKSPCFGNCPVYEMKIKDSLLLYKGDFNVDKVGFHKKILLPEVMDSLYKLIDYADFFNLEEVYDHPQVMDLPSTMISARKGESYKKIESRIGTPGELRKLENFLHGLILTDFGWIKSSKEEYYE